MQVHKRGEFDVAKRAAKTGSVGDAPRRGMVLTLSSQPSVTVVQVFEAHYFKTSGKPIKVGYTPTLVSAALLCL
jgi:hypothetical protein